MQMMRAIFRPVILLMGLVGAWMIMGSPAIAQPGPTAREMRWELGIPYVQDRMGEATPTGAGVIVGQAEGGPGQYTPNRNHNMFAPVDFTLASGPSATFGHAQQVARIFYGRQGIATGVTEVHSYTTQGWLQNYLRIGSDQPPVEDAVRVFNHSWISRDARGVEQVLYRVDYQSDVRDVLIVCGVDNGRHRTIPPMLSSAYNVLAVGTAQGNGASAGGYTTVDTVGRCKPDLVGPRGLTSFATPSVAGVAACLIEFADRFPEAELVPATRTETLRAVLMAGARKPEHWTTDPGRPLSEHLGAGVVNLNRALRIMEGGPLVPSQPMPLAGWDHRAFPTGATGSYRFTLAEDAEQVAFSLNWNRRIHPVLVEHPNVAGRRIWAGVPYLADFNLRLFRMPDGNTTGEQLIAESVSEIDNVEHLYLPELEAGAYRVEVTRIDHGLPPQPWDYTLAWFAKVEP